MSLTPFPKIIFTLLLLLSCPPVLADWIVQIGPASVNNGEANPLSIPPTNPADYQIISLDKQGIEWRFAISPGFFRGHRFYLGKSYLALGSGFVISTWGGSFGAYGAVGYDHCYVLCFNFEYMKALGLFPQVTQPYTIKVGIIFGKN
mgnify:CR=1 FL=1